MKMHILFLIIGLFLCIPQNQLLAQSEQIAAVYYDEKQPVAQLKKVATKEGKKIAYQKNNYPKNKKPIFKKTESMKETGLVLLIIGAIALGIGIILFIIGLWSSLALVALGILLGLFGLTGLIVGGVLFGVAKRKESGN